MDAIITQYHKTPIGELILGDYQGKLCLMDYRYRKMREQIDNRIRSHCQASFVEGHSELLESAKAQLSEYLQGERQGFDLPIDMIGTDFQKSVWNALLEIGYGQTQSYLDLAKRLGNVNGIRAIASANGANAISIIVPCHRIIGSDGKLVGYGGGLPAKQKLLELEAQNSANKQGKLF